MEAKSYTLINIMISLVNFGFMGLTFRLHREYFIDRWRQEKEKRDED